MVNFKWFLCGALIVLCGCTKPPLLPPAERERYDSSMSEVRSFIDSHIRCLKETPNGDCQTMIYDRIDALSKKK